MENNNIDLASLSQHFTEEELATVLPKEEAENAEVVAEQAEPQEEQHEEPSQPDSDIVQEEKPQKLKPTVIAYDRFKEVNDKAKALAAELAALKAQKPVDTTQPVFEQPKPVQPSQAEAKAKYYAMLSSTADKQAREILGISDADLTELQFVDNAKYQALLDTRATIVQEMHRENMVAFQVRQANEQYVSKLQSDPMFGPVYQFAIQDMQDLPLKEVAKFQQAEARVSQMRGTDADFALLDKYLDEYKAKFLAITGQKPVMPQVSVTQTKAPIEKAEGLPRANNLSGAKTAAMSWQQVEQLIRDGKADQIPKEMLSQIDPKLIE